jgi:hypothetical protein
MAKANSSEPQATTPAPVPGPTAIDQNSLTIEELARGVLDRSLRPRTGSIRRLAEAVLEIGDGVKKSKKKKSADAAGKSGKKSGGKKRKLAKIPRSKE